MSRKAKHNAIIRQRILDAAAARFRTHGYHATRIDEIMEGAGLTRGAFYAHFPEKAALFTNVLAMEPLLLRWLKARSEAAPDALWLAMTHVFRAYLDPDNHALIMKHCTLAMLHRAAALADPAAREAYQSVYAATRAEMQRGAPPGVSLERLDGVLSMTLGAVGVAAAFDDDHLARQTLVSARKTADSLLAAPDHFRDPAVNPDRFRIDKRPKPLKGLDTPPFPL